MIYDLCLLIVAFMLSFFWAPPRPIQYIVWALLAVALLSLLLPSAGLGRLPRY